MPESEVETLMDKTPMVGFAYTMNPFLAMLRIQRYQLAMWRKFTGL